MSTPSQYWVAIRLLELFVQQYEDGESRPPLTPAFLTLKVDDQVVDIEDPHEFEMPREGTLQVGVGVSSEAVVSSLSVSQGKVP